MDRDPWPRPKPEMLPCGGMAIFDPDSTTYASRCNRCFAVVGSVGMPRECERMWREQLKEDRTDG